MLQKVLSDCTAGLAYLHGCQVVHRDLKPQNILRSGEGSYKLADFGCSSFLSSKEKTTTTKGTPCYMVPARTNCSVCTRLAPAWHPLGTTLAPPVPQAAWAPPHLPTRPPLDLRPRRSTANHSLPVYGQR